MMCCASFIISVGNFIEVIWLKMVSLWPHLLREAQRDAPKPIPIGSTRNGRSREDSMMRASPATFSRAIAPRITAKASWPISPRGAM
jgi:hypothetical protein